MAYLIGLGIIAVVAAGVVALVSFRRSHSEKSSWLGELDEIRRTSLGDDQEVTGAIHAVHLDEDAFAGADDDELEDQPDPNGPAPSTSETDSNGPAPSTSETDSNGDRDGVGVDDGNGSGRSDVQTDLSLQSITDEPDRTVSDAGTLFNEYQRVDEGLLRVETTNPQGLRILSSLDDPPQRFAVDLRDGVLWHRGPTATGVATCTVRTPNAWIMSSGTVLVVVDDEWTFAICLDGTSNVRTELDEQVLLRRGEIVRLQRGTTTVGVIDVGVDALETEGVVRRQRRLDATGKSS